MRSKQVVALRIASIAACCLLLPAAVQAEKAWVKEGHEINLRSGAGVSFRVIGTIETGDIVEILEQGDGWTEVRPETAPAGWIRSGFLQDTPPARLMLAELTAEKERFEARLAEVSASEAKLREEHGGATQRNIAQQAEIDRLTLENVTLRASERWPEWLTGAGIILLGMLLGAMVSRGSGRRRTQRIKL